MTYRVLSYHLNDLSCIDYQDIKPMVDKDLTEADLLLFLSSLSNGRQIDITVHSWTGSCRRASSVTFTKLIEVATAN